MLPAFKTTPPKKNDSEWFRKFCLMMLRMHCHYVLPLDQLEKKETFELHQQCEQVFTEDGTPVWIADLWQGNNQHLPYRPPNAPSPQIGTPDEELPTADEIQIDGNLVQDANILEDDDNSADNLDGDVVFDEDDTNSTEIDYLYDKNSMCPLWTEQTGNQWRNDNLKFAQAEDDSDDTPALALHQLNEKQQKAVNLVLQKAELALSYQDEQFFVEICGSAGTGKSAIQHCLRRLLKEKVADLCRGQAFGDLVHFTAPTGTAVKLLPTPNATVHSLLGIPIKPAHNKAPPKHSESVLKKLQEKIGKLKILFIDEKSFIGLWFFYMISHYLQQIKANKRPFGGVSIILLGDNKQLIPVADKPLFTELGKVQQKLNKFEVQALRLYNDNFTNIVILTQLVRQQGDEQYRTLLTRFTQGQFSHEDWRYLATRCFDQITKEEQHVFNKEAVMVCAMKKDYALFNKKKLSQLTTDKFLVCSINSPANVASLSSTDAQGLARNIVLAKGMRVMLTVNLCLPYKLSNGSLGTVKGIVYFSNQPDITDHPTVLIKFDDYSGPSVFDDHDQVVPINSISRSWMGPKNVTCQRTMLPLQPAYAFSIHKSQGQTVKKMVLNLGTREFAAGLTYTALTRVKTLQDLAFTLPMASYPRIRGIFKTNGYKLQVQDEQHKFALENRQLSQDSEE